MKYKRTRTNTRTTLNEVVRRDLELRNELGRSCDDQKLPSIAPTHGFDGSYSFLILFTIEQLLLFCASRRKNSLWSVLSLGLGW